MTGTQGQQYSMSGSRAEALSTQLWCLPLNIEITEVVYSSLWFFVCTVEHHPAMKEVIAGEVERLVYRPNVGQRAQ